MSDLISRELMKSIGGTCIAQRLKNGDLCPIISIDLLPPVEPEIIRCKDCKFYTSTNRETKTGICNLTMHQNFGDEWYCAGAERRTDEQAVSE